MNAVGAYTYLQAKLDALPSIATTTDGRIPFVQVPTPLAMIEWGGSTGWSGRNRTAGTLTTWWSLDVRIAVIIGMGDALSIEAVATAEERLRTVNQEILDAFRADPLVNIGQISAQGAAGWQKVNGRTFRMMLVPFEVRDQIDYEGGPLP